MQAWNWEKKENLRVVAEMALQDIGWRPFVTSPGRLSRNSRGVVDMTSVYIGCWSAADEIYSLLQAT